MIIGEDRLLSWCSSSLNPTLGKISRRNSHWTEAIRPLVPSGTAVVKVQRIRKLMPFAVRRAARCPYPERTSGRLEKYEFNGSTMKPVRRRVIA